MAKSKKKEPKLHQRKQKSQYRFKGLVDKKSNAKLNPFEASVNRTKTSVFGKKTKDAAGRPGFSRSEALKKRSQTILPEYQNIDKANKMIDRRIGERNTLMSEEDRSMARFTAERRRSHVKRALFQLDEDEVLTHKGQTLNEIEKFDDPRSDDDSENDDEKRKGGKLTDKFVAEAHFGGGLLSRTGKEGARSHSDIIDQLIHDSKRRKVEMQQTKEETNKLMEKLDSDWKDLLPLVVKQNKNDVAEPAKVDDYDKAMRELKFEARGNPTDRLKSVKETEREEAERLKQLEDDRMARMMAEDDTVKKRQLRSADGLDDNFAYDDSDDDKAMAYDEGRLINVEPSYEIIRPDSDQNDNGGLDSNDEDGSTDDDSSDGDSIDEDSTDNKIDIDIALQRNIYHANDDNQANEDSDDDNQVNEDSGDDNQQIEDSGDYNEQSNSDDNDELEQNNASDNIQDDSEYNDSQIVLADVSPEGDSDNDDTQNGGSDNDEDQDGSEYNDSQIVLADVSPDGDSDNDDTQYGGSDYDENQDGDSDYGNQDGDSDDGNQDGGVDDEVVDEVIINISRFHEFINEPTGEESDSEMSSSYDEESGESSVSTEDFDDDSYQSSEDEDYDPSTEETESEIDCTEDELNIDYTDDEGSISYEYNENILGDFGIPNPPRVDSGVDFLGEYEGFDNIPDVTEDDSSDEPKESFDPDLDSEIASIEQRENEYNLVRLEEKEGMALVRKNLRTYSNLYYPDDDIDGQSLTDTHTSSSQSSENSLPFMFSLPARDDRLYEYKGRHIIIRDYKDDLVVYIGDYFEIIKRDELRGKLKQIDVWEKNMIQKHYIFTPPEEDDTLKYFYRLFENQSSYLLEYVLDKSLKDNVKRDTLNKFFICAMNGVFNYDKSFNWLRLHASFLYKLSKAVSPELCQNYFIEKLTEVQGMLKANLTVKSQIYLSVFKLVAIIYPTSDFRHQIVTPTILVMCQILNTPLAVSKCDVAAKLMVIALYLEYISLSKRVLPDVMNFLVRIIKSTNRGPPEGPKVRTLLRVNSVHSHSKVQDHRVNITALNEERVDEVFKIQALHTILSIVDKLLDHWKDLASAQEYFRLIAIHITRIRLAFYTETVRNQCSSLLCKFQKLESTNVEELSFASEKPKALRLYEPKVETVYDRKTHAPMSKQKAELAKLQYKHKREMKGAIREIRRDTSFLGRVKIKRKIEGDLERQAKVKRIFGEASAQQGELNQVAHSKKK